MAITRGLITAVRNYEIAVCAYDSFRKTTTYHEDLNYFITSNGTRLGIGTDIRKDAAIFTHMVIFENCDYCGKNIKYKNHEK